MSKVIRPSIKNTELTDDSLSKNSEDSTFSGCSTQTTFSNENKPKKKKVTFKKTMKIVFVESWKSYNIDVSSNGGCEEWDKKKRKNHKKNKTVENKKINKSNNDINYYSLLDENFCIDLNLVFNKQKNTQLCNIF